MRAIAALLAGAGLTLAVACTSSPTTVVQRQPTSAASQPPAGATATPADETALAKSLLFSVSDFPTGWAEQQSQNNSTKISDQCNAQGIGRTGQAKTGDFSQGQTASVWEDDGVFVNSGDASAALDGIQSVVQCKVGLFNAGKADDSQYAYSNASLSPVSFPQFGDKSTAYRLQFHVKAKGQTGLGSEGDGFVDLVAVIIGRVGFSLTAVDTFSPFDSTQLQSLVAKAEAKVRAGLATQTR